MCRHRAPTDNPAGARVTGPHWVTSTRRAIKCPLVIGSTTTCPHRPAFTNVFGLGTGCDGFPLLTTPSTTGSLHCLAAKSADGVPLRPLRRQTLRGTWCREAQRSNRHRASRPRFFKPAPTVGSSRLTRSPRSARLTRSSGQMLSQVACAPARRLALAPLALALPDLSQMPSCARRRSAYPFLGPGATTEEWLAHHAGASLTVSHAGCPADSLWVLEDFSALSVFTHLGLWAVRRSGLGRRHAAGAVRGASY